MQWYQQKFRRNLVDMHIEDWDPAFLSNFDPDEYVELLKLGHINAPMLYLQSHVGLCYWPTKSGKMHAGFLGKEDAMRRVEQKCHAENMSVIAYYSLIYNNWAYDEHPGWRMRDVNGDASRANGTRYGQLCPNHMDYRAFTEAQIKELCEYFDFEGIFLDMTFWPMVCYCDQCKARWGKEVGGEMPTVIDWHDEKWLLFQKKRTDWLGEFARWATATVEKYKPGCAVEHQYSPIMHYWRFGVSENITEASTYAGGDLYGGIAQQSFACKLYYNVTKNQPFEYMTSRCYPALSEHTTTKSMDLLRLSVMMTYLHHGACLLIDAIDPVGTMDRRVYERIGQVFREAEPYEEYLTWGEMTHDVALYYDLNGKYDPHKSPSPVGSGAENDHAMPMQEALLGASRSMQRHHIPYTVISNWKLDSMRRGKVIALCDLPGLDAAHEAEILDYVKGGGRLYMSGISSPTLLKEIFGLTVDGETEEEVTYISPAGAGEALMRGMYTKEYPLAMFERQIRTSGAAKGEVLGTMTLPYTVPGAGAGAVLPFFERGGQESADEPRFRFASIHSNPPGIFTDRPSIVRARYGAGEAIWCAAPIEKPDREQHADIFADIMRLLCGGELRFTAEAPETVECILFDAPEHSAKLMGLINLQDAFHTQPVYDFSVSIRSDKAPARVYRVPDGEEVEYTYENGMVHVHFDRMTHYEMIAIAY